MPQRPLVSLGRPALSRKRSSVPSSDTAALPPLRKARDATLCASLPRGPWARGSPLEDPFRSRIWVKEGRLALIERHLPEGSFRIHLETWREVGERLLPHRFLLVHRDPRGHLLKVERFRDEYAQVGPYWLPVEREVVVEGEGLGVLVLRLEEVEVKG